MTKKIFVMMETIMVIIVIRTEKHKSNSYDDQNYKLIIMTVKILLIVAMTNFGRPCV